MDHFLRVCTDTVIRSLVPYPIDCFSADATPSLVELKRSREVGFIRSTRVATSSIDEAAFIAFWSSIGLE